MHMRLRLGLACGLMLGGCAGDADRGAVDRDAATQQAAQQAAMGRMDPARTAGAYELWICGTAECGPGTAMAGTRFGRLVLTSSRVVAADSSAAFAGCLNIGNLQQFDRSSAMKPIAWAPTERPGELVFTAEHNSEGEYEIALNDLGEMLRGRGRWRRGGVFGEETPEFVVARRLARVPAECPGLATPGAFDAVASPLPGFAASKQIPPAGGRAAAPKAAKPTP